MRNLALADLEIPMEDEKTGLAVWLGFSAICLFFFHITSTTFTSLGVALPYMMEELNWGYSGAGLGFSILALVVGLSGLVPAWVIRRASVKASFALGGFVMCSGFALLATTNSLPQYFLGTGLAGFGFTLCGNVPAVHFINTMFARPKRSGAIGIYLTVGGFGGVLGPILVESAVGLTQDWRIFWWVAATVTAVMIAITLLFINGPSKAQEADSAKAENALESDTGGPAWTYAQVIRTRQFQIIVASLTLTLFCGLTLNSWAVKHMTNLGVSTAVAAGALSGHALINALSRGFGAIIVKRVAAKWLMVSALAAEVVGMFALAHADNPTTIFLFGLGEGYGYGMCLFATTVLLVDYFGTAKNPELLGSMHLVTTLAMVGPVLAGFIAERVGGFGVIFMGYGVFVFGLMIAAAFMKAPVPPKQV